MNPAQPRRPLAPEDRAAIARVLVILGDESSRGYVPAQLAVDLRTWAVCHGFPPLPALPTKAERDGLLQDALEASERMG